MWIVIQIRIRFLVIFHHVFAPCSISVTKSLFLKSMDFDFFVNIMFLSTWFKFISSMWFDLNSCWDFKFFHRLGGPLRDLFPASQDALAHTHTPLTYPHPFPQLSVSKFVEVLHFADTFKYAQKHVLHLTPQKLPKMFLNIIHVWNIFQQNSKHLPIKVFR